MFKGWHEINLKFLKLAFFNCCFGLKLARGLFSLKQFEMEFSKEITNYKLCLATGINQYTIDNVWQQVKKLRTLSKLITNSTGRLSNSTGRLSI